MSGLSLGDTVMTPKTQRLLGIALIFTGLTIAVGLSLWGLRENVSFFYTPSELSELSETSQRIRLGGLVQGGSITKNGLETHFIVTDKEAYTKVIYTGLLPDLFREGQGVIAFGIYDNSTKTFEANRLLAKHDENYIPPELAKKLEEQDHIRHKVQAK